MPFRGLAGYLVMIVAELFVPIIAVIGYLGIALYYIIPFRRGSRTRLPSGSAAVGFGEGSG
jgi:hypothetical protein